MANSLIMSYVLRKFKNARSSSNNRWFAYVNKTGNITTRGLAEFLIQLGVHEGLRQEGFVRQRLLPGDLWCQGADDSSGCRRERLRAKRITSS